MTDAVAVGLAASMVPTVGILIVWLQSETSFAAIDQRFDDMREFWRERLHRFEEDLDLRLKRLEKGQSS